jgi:excisionase family DNA binding protein
VPTTAPEPLLTVAEVAAELRLSVKTVRRMIARGALPARQIGRLWRVRRTHLDAVIRGSL